jgi:hypothetical protein
MEEDAKKPDQGRVSRRTLLGLAGAAVAGAVLAAPGVDRMSSPDGAPRIRTRPLTREELYEDHDLGG